MAKRNQKRRSSGRPASSAWSGGLQTATSRCSCRGGRARGPVVLRGRHDAHGRRRRTRRSYERRGGPVADEVVDFLSVNACSFFWEFLARRVPYKRYSRKAISNVSIKTWYGSSFKSCCHQVARPLVLFLVRF